MIEFPFAANALRQAEAATYPAPYVTPLTREGVTQLNAAEYAIGRERIKEENRVGIRKFNMQEIAEIKRLYREERMGNYQLADLFNCDPTSIWHYTKAIMRSA